MVLMSLAITTHVSGGCSTQWVTIIGLEPTEHMFGNYIDK